jgi:hypothetical protein
MGLLDRLLERMVDEKGLFQGGKQGKAFGRIRDLFGRGGGHENIDEIINQTERPGGGLSAAQGQYSPEHFLDIMKGAAPRHYEKGGRQMMSPQSHAVSQPYTSAMNIDAILQAISSPEGANVPQYPSVVKDVWERSDEGPRFGGQVPKDITDILQYLDYMKDAEEEYR